MIKRMFQLNNSDLLGSPDSLMPASTPSIISPAQSYRWNDPDVFRSIWGDCFKSDYDWWRDRPNPKQCIEFDSILERLLTIIAFDYIKLKYLGQGAGIWVETCETLGQALKRKYINVKMTMADIEWCCCCFCCHLRVPDWLYFITSVKRVDVVAVFVVI